MAKTHLTLVAVALLAISGGVFWYQTRNQSIPTSSSPQVSEQKSNSSAIVMEGGNAINVESQEGGDTIEVDLAILDEPGFVVIHKATKDDKLGEVVGHSDLLLKGQNKDVVIEVDPAAKKGDVYFAMLHGDSDGDKDYGSADEDKPLKDDQGSIVAMKLTITFDSVPQEE